MHLDFVYLILRIIEINLTNFSVLCDKAKTIHGMILSNNGVGVSLHGAEVRKDNPCYDTQ